MYETNSNVINFGIRNTDLPKALTWQMNNEFVNGYCFKVQQRSS